MRRVGLLVDVVLKVQGRGLTLRRVIHGIKPLTYLSDKFLNISWFVCSRNYHDYRQNFA